MTVPNLSQFPTSPRAQPSPDIKVSLSPFHAVARFLLVATLCGAPWAFGAVQPWAWATMLVLSLTALALWAAGCVHRGVVRIAWSPLYWPFLALLAVALWQFFAGLSTDHTATREAILKLMTNFLIFFLAGQLLNAQRENGRSLEWFGLIVTLQAFALCALGLAQVFVGNPRAVYWTYVLTAPFGPYVNHNNYAGLMETLLPVLVGYLFSRHWPAALQFASWCGIILVITSIWISGSRGAAAVVLLEGLIWGAILVWQRPRNVSPRLFAVLLGVALVSAGFFAWLVSTGHVVSRAWSVFGTDRSLGVKLGDRYLVAKDTLRMARHNPVLGVGVGCFESVFPSYLTFTMDRHWTHAHNDVFEAAAETGLPGVIMILAAVGLFFPTAFRRIRERLHHGWGWMQVGAAVGAVGLFCHSFVDFNLRVPANAAWFVVCLAIATHLRPAEADSRRPLRDFMTGRGSESLT